LHAAFVPSLTGLGILSFPFPGTAVPGYRLLRPFGTEFILLLPSVLHLKAPRLGDAAPEVFMQQRLWPSAANPEDTAVQLISKIGYVVRRREESSDLYDQPLLKHFAHWRKLFQREVKEIHLPGAADMAAVPVTLDMSVVQNATALSQQTPAPRQARVVGKLDMVRHNTRSFGLMLAGGEEVRGVLLQYYKPILARRLQFSAKLSTRSSGSRGVCAVPNGTRNSLFSVSRHCRAGLQTVASLRD
jgi:hypothetical protein